MPGGEAGLFPQKRMSGQDERRKFDRLYDTFRLAVFGFAYHLTQDRGEAEELFQETWLRVVRHLPGEMDMKRAKAWLFTITSNLHRDRLRRKRVRRLFLQRRKGTFAGAGIREGEEHRKRPPERWDATRQVDLARAISWALEKLPQRHRLVFVLKEMEGFSQAEISEMLGVPLGTVKSMMFRAVKKLRRELAAYASGE